MIRNDRKIQEIIHGDIIKRVAEARKINISEARDIVSRMSFKEYMKLGEDITPPSGSAIGPTSNATTPSANPSQPPAGAATAVSWPGKGTPVEVGMTVGLKGPNGLPVPGQVSQVDMASKGVKVKNPTTGQEEWQNTDNLNPYTAAGAGAAQLPANGTQPGTATSGAPVTTTTEDAGIKRMRQLAGIRENASAGATGAGSIAVAPAAMGQMQKRQHTDEERKVEYTRTEPAKSIIGDTKPFQASGKLSADLSANGMKSAGRANNGMKRKR